MIHTFIHSFMNGLHVHVVAPLDSHYTDGQTKIAHALGKYLQDQADKVIAKMKCSRHK